VIFLPPCDNGKTKIEHDIYKQLEVKPERRHRRTQPGRSYEIKGFPETGHEGAAAYYTCIFAASLVWASQKMVVR